MVSSTRTASRRAPAEPLLERLQRGVVVVAARDRDTFRIGPFTALVDPLRDSYYVSYAVPDPGTGAETDALDELEQAFRARARIPRLEFLEDLSPELPAVLEARGWRLTERIPVLTCEPGRLRRSPPPGELEIVTAAAEHAHEHLQVQRTAFGDDDAITEEEIERWRERNADWIRLAGLRDGRIVGVASAAPPVGGTAELVGIATL